ncbi:magnesium transporter [Lentisphaerota bacterium ZTH]|nr:magnesium transporter [Lentisphaerota bacterium]WET06904.1 magnesium transporter [Lentisphaerota bacterium ZTH]
MSSIDYDKNTMREMLVAGRYEEIRRTLRHTDPADVADILEDLDSEEVELIFSILDNEFASEVLVEMEVEDAEEVIDHMPPSKVAKMMAEMAPDDAADILQELDDQNQARILHFLDEDKKNELSELAEYEGETAGGLMTPEFCAVSIHATIKQAINAIAAADFLDPITTVFGVDRNGCLVGSINISELISKPGKMLVNDVIDQDPVYSLVDEDREELALKVRKYDLLVIPVVDHDNRLVGRVTIDDVLDVMDEEAVEDMARMAGAPDMEHKESSPFSIARLRLPWLLVTMMTGTIVSFILQQLISLESAACLAAFVPVILGMGGNTGMQATAVTVRSIALGEIELSRLLRVFIREMMVGAMMGVVCGIIIAGVVYINLWYFGGIELSFSLAKLVMVVGCSMFTAMTFAALTGTVLPIIMHHFKVDPAVASGPFVTTGNDLSASLIYLGMCYVMLGI